MRCWPPEAPKAEEALRERWFGDFDATADSNYERVWAEDKLSATHERFGVESIESVAGRTEALLQRLDADLTDEPWLVLLVAHGDVLQITQAAQEGCDIRTHRSLEHLPTATLREFRRLRGGSRARTSLAAATAPAPARPSVAEVLTLSFEDHYPRGDDHCFFLRERDQRLTLNNPARFRPR